MSSAGSPYDAVLVVSFGGPEGPDDVLPFMENVTRGRGISRDRLELVSGHYRLFGGVSPINAQNRLLVSALESELAAARCPLPVYWGNRNWHPMLADTIEHMRADGIGRAIAFVTSAFSSASGCRQYRDDIEAARRHVGPDAPVVDKLRVFFNHPGFLQPVADNTVRTLEGFDQLDPLLLFTAHSLPMSMAASSRYVEQLEESCRLVVEMVGSRTATAPRWRLVFQSRSGAPNQPWLEPDICDALSAARNEGVGAVVVVPIGFISDHMEVVYDLDTQAAEHAESIGLAMVRVPTVGTDPRFVSMIRELIVERMEAESGQMPTRRFLGSLGPHHDVCPQDCCPLSVRPTSDVQPANSARRSPMPSNAPSAATVLDTASPSP